MIIFVYGQDLYRSQAYVRRLVDKFKVERDAAGCNVIEIEAATAKQPGQILQEILAAPFLAEKRLVVLRNFLSAKDAPDRATVLERIIAGTLPEDTITLFWESTSTFKTKEAKALFAELKKSKFCEEFAPLSPPEAQRWVTQEAERRGTKIDPGAATQLVTNLGTDTWSLSTTVDQLVAYAAGRTITVADIAQFVPEKVPDNIFALAEAIANGQAKQVFAQCQEQYRLGQDSIYIHAMLVRQFRILIGIAGWLQAEPRAAAPEIAAALGIHPYVAQKSLALAKKIPLTRLTRAHQLLAELDQAAKSGQGEHRQLFEIFLGKYLLQSV